MNYLSNGAINATGHVNPYTRQGAAGARSVPATAAAWQRPVHQGSLSPVWKFLVFLSGLVPALFVVTGIIMWVQEAPAPRAHDHADR